MSVRFQTAALATLLLLTPVMASAQLFDVTNETTSTPRGHAFEIKFGPYTPNIDQESGLSVNPYDVVFDSTPMFMTKLEYDWQFFQDFGSLALAFEFGYGSVTGKGQLKDGGGNSSDETTLHLIPISIGIAYNFDVLAIRWNIPLVPYVKLGIDYSIWIVTDGLGSITSDSDSGTDGSGDTWGWHTSVGLKILLDTFAPDMAQSFDIEAGVNNSYIFAELLYADISDFGSSKSWDVGALTGLFGLAFEF